MKKSDYNILFPYKENMFILFNSFSNATALLDTAMFEKFQSDSLNLNELSQFAKQGFYVEDSVDELSYVLLANSKSVFQSNLNLFRILTTTRCNANCAYCYEDKRIPCDMSEETANAVVEFIKGQTVSSSKISINWFGGEPLLNHKIISYINRRLRQELPDHSIRQVITTNGSLFTKSLIRKASTEWMIDTVQMTLDGYGEYHNNTKSYNNFPNAFNRTIDTIDALLSNGLKVSVRMNVDKQNYKSIYELVLYLDAKFHKRDGFFCYAYPLFDENVDRICCNGYRDNLIYDSDLEKFFFPISDKIIALNVNPHETLRFCRQKTVSCGSAKEGNFVIDPCGLLYKCSFEIGNPNRSVGNVFDGIVLNSHHLKYILPKYSKDCYSCKLLPMCQGGCRYQFVWNSTHRCTVNLDMLRHDLINIIEKISATNS